ncbi:MAG: MerR family DNA-binding protein [Fibrobacteria bacterium]
MLIGELSKRTGISRDTIRFYEKEALIIPTKPPRKAFFSNNYKDYPDAVVSSLLFIQGTKALGFTLSEIREMLKLRSLKQKGSKNWTAKAEEKLAEIDRKIADLNNLKTLLSEALARCSDQCLDEGCQVLDDAVAKKSKSGSPPMRDNRISGKGNCCS